MASYLMASEVTSPQTVLEVLALQPASTLVVRTDGVVTATLGVLLLRPPGHQQLIAGVFNAKQPDLSVLCRGADVPAAGYLWGIAAADKTAAAAALAFCRTMDDRTLRHVVAFTRAVTPVGRHLAGQRFGFKPCRHPDDDLLVRAPLADEEP